MAIMFVRAQVISRGAGRSIVSAAAYRHRARMVDEQAGTSFSYRGGADELKHEELALPDEIPNWLTTAIEGKTVAAASEVLWNAVDAFEKRVDAQLARELVIALPEELTRAENIALVREFIRENLTAKGMVADWVYHDRDSNPHIHLMMTLRPLREQGFGSKMVAVSGPDGKPLRVIKPDRPNGAIVYSRWAGDKETMKEWKIAWAETTNRHLALAGHDIRLDGRSYAEQGLDGIAQKHLGPEKAALARKNMEMYFAPADLVRRQEMADRLLVEPELLLKQLERERSTFNERDIARTLHRYVDDPADFASIRTRVMASNNLVLLRPQQVDRQTGKVAEPAVFTSQEILRTEFDMVGSAEVLSKRTGFRITDKQRASALGAIETADPEKPFRLEQEQIDAVHHVTSDSAIAAIVGLAGAGKSTLLSVARIAWESGHHRVLGAALAGKAAEGLEESSGIKSRTLAAWELAWANERDLLKRGDVFVIEEAGMVPSQQMARVLEAAKEAGAKVVLVGDAMQLQPIQAGAAFRAIAERIGSAELAGVRRQREGWARDASHLFARGEVEKGLDAYLKHGHLIEARTHDEIIGRLVSDWADARRSFLQQSKGEESAFSYCDKLLVLAHTNKDVRLLNESLREEMKKECALTVPREFRTERGMREFAVGDRIIFLENSRFIETRATGFGPQYVKNGLLGTVVSTGDRHDVPLLSVRLDNGRDVIISEDSYRNIDYGYAATIHKAQGTTVERTFVLATGMMDQHLTYVAMTRHRDRTDLYAAREDFEPKAEWGGKSRIDHAVGVTGELVEAGMAKFRPQDDDVDESPYADVKTDDGTVHRLWGVSLPKALSDAGVSEGDTVLLKKDGVEIVKVTIPVLNTETGKKTYEERQVERNVWTAKQIETAAMRLERIERESHRPELFGQLVERLGRSGAKTTTLDFENEADYQAHVRDFARRRGINTISGMAADIEDKVTRQWSWIVEKREQVAKLWERANVALGFTIEHEKNVSYNEERSEKRATDNPIERVYLIPPTTRFVRSIEEDARLAQLSSDRWKKREVVLRSFLEKIYRDPDSALATLNGLASDASVEPRRVADNLQHLGHLRGSGRLIDDRITRNDRKAALNALSQLAPLVRAHATEFRRQAERFKNREEKRRSYMALSIPALSKPALARLTEIESVREHGGPDAYKIAFAYAVEDRLLVQEVKAVNEALTARFGRTAFTKNVDAVGERNMIERMPEDLDSDRRDKLTDLFGAIRRFCDEQKLAERQDRSQVVAAASVEPGKKTRALLPMLAAVTEFRIPVKDEARARARDVAHYRHDRAALVEIAKRIWRDPAGAVDQIEALILKGFPGERIARAIVNEPSAYGAIRGSDRIMDRLLAIGRERRNALKALGDAESQIRSLGSSYRAALENQIKSITEERRRMAIPIPGMSSAAENALRKLTDVTKTKGAKPNVAANSLDAVVCQEFERVSRALDLRFGRDAILRGEKAVINHVSLAQRPDFEAMRFRLKILQQTVRKQAHDKVIVQRRQRSVNQVQSIDR